MPTQQKSFNKTRRGGAKMQPLGVWSGSPERWALLCTPLVLPVAGSGERMATLVCLADIATQGGHDLCPG